MKDRKLLWIGDAAVASGFARCTHHVLSSMSLEWDIHILGLNYKGDPHEYPYHIYPCWPGGDPFGLGRVKEMIEKIGPDVIIIQNDPWNIPAYLDRIENIPVIASMPVDGLNCQGRKLNKLTHAIFWTNFGLNEARFGGYSGEASVIPLGVDINLYQRVPQARQKIGLPEDILKGFVVGNVNRNQPRKRLDLSIQYFSEWVKEYHITDAFIYFHVAPTGDASFDVVQLCEYYGVVDRLIIAQPEIGQGIKEKNLSTTYSCFDVQISTTQGEGWGLTTMEGMACGVPQIVPNWAALGEWAEEAAFQIPCSTISVTPNNINVVGGIADKEPFIEALNLFYLNPRMCDDYKNKGMELTSRSEYRWKNISKKFSNVVDSVVGVAK